MTQKKIKILDLFCGIGGSAIGIKQAIPNAEITGIDNKYKDYPFEFIQKDVSQLTSSDLKKYDFIWASPPCQEFSITTARAKSEYGKTYENWIDFTRDLIKESGKPGIIENVSNCMILKNPIILRGEHFPNTRDIRRPRKFESINFSPLTPPKSKFTKIYPSKRLIGGGGGFVDKDIKEGRSIERMSIEEAKQRFKIRPHGTKKNQMHEIGQIVLPQYSEFIMKQWLKTKKSKSK